MLDDNWHIGIDGARVIRCARDRLWIVKIVSDSPNQKVARGFGHDYRTTFRSFFKANTAAICLPVKIDNQRHQKLLNP